MMRQIAALPSSAWLALALVAGAAAALAAVAYGYGPLESLVRRNWHEYEGWANTRLRAIYSPLRAPELALRHVVVALAPLLLGPIFGAWFFAAALAALFAWLPVMWLERQVTSRRHALELQLDTTLQSLANTILVTQNLEDAFAQVAQHFDPPISQEADVLVKQVRLGTPMDEALRDLAARCKSRNVDAIVTSLTVGRQTGGELPRVLETTASVLRETMRVEGVMEAKTSEGKAQAVVMGLLPFVFGGALQLIDPEWMEPLFHDPIGWAILTFACLLELVGVAMVRKLSTIDV
jgi:tight adherence protein B